MHLLVALGLAPGSGILRALDGEWRGHAIALQVDGKAIIGGPFSKVNEVQRANLARLNLHGTLDLQWGSWHRRAGACTR